MTEFARAVHDTGHALCVALDDAQAEQLDGLRSLLQAWNQRLNLVGDPSDEALLHKHFADGLAHVAALRQAGVTSGRLVDVGTGAGLPGLVIQIAAPELEVVLLDSLGKRLRVIEQMVAELGLSQAVLLEARAEDVGQDSAWRETCAAATARRVAELSVVLEYCLPLVCVGGLALLPKGEGLDQELSDAAGVSELLGGSVPDLIEVALPPDTAIVWGTGVRRFVVVRKVAPTPPEYPRKPGRPAKRPLRAKSG